VHFNTFLTPKASYSRSMQVVLADCRDLSVVRAGCEFCMDSSSSISDASARWQQGVHGCWQQDSRHRETKTRGLRMHLPAERSSHEF